MAAGLMHRGLESAAAPVPGPRRPCWRATTRWTFGELDRAGNAFAGHLAGQGVGPGDRVAVMTSNRPEFVVAVHARQQARRGRRPAQPGLEGARGRARRSTSPRPCYARRRRRRRRARWPSASGAAPSLDLDDARRGRVDRPAARPAARRPTVRRGRRRRPRLQLGDDRTCPRRSATPTGPSAAATAHWCRGARPRPRRPVPGGDARRRTSSGCSTCWPRPRRAPPSACTAASTSTRSSAASRTERMTLEMAVAPIALAMANHPRPRGLRPLVAALHHVGRDAGHARSVAETVTARTGVRWLPAYGASEVPVIAANPVGRPGRLAARLGRAARPAASRCASPTSTPARSSARGRSARSRSRARRPWPATCPTRPRRTRSPTAGTAPATSAGSSPRAGST